MENNEIDNPIVQTIFNVSVVRLQEVEAALLAERVKSARLEATVKEMQEMILRLQKTSNDDLSDDGE